jgi:hypothetical protein
MRETNSEVANYLVLEKEVIMTNTTANTNVNEVVNQENLEVKESTMRVDFGDLTTKQSTTVKNRAKEALDKLIMEKLLEVFGEENVSEVFKDANGKGRAISVAVGTVNDEGGFPIEVCVNVELTAKAITATSRKTASGTSYTDIYDRLTEAEIYKNAIEEKAQIKSNKEKEKEAKKQKDKERREAIKAQKESKSDTAQEETKEGE